MSCNVVWQLGCLRSIWNFYRGYTLSNLKSERKTDWIEVVKAILSFDVFWPPSNRKSYSWPQATINALHTDFLWWGGVERLESGLISWNDCFRDTDTEKNEKLHVFRHWLFLCRSNLRLIFHSSLAVFWVSLKFEERSEDTANFPLTLNNFFTSCARLHKILSEQTYLLSIFIQKLFFKIADTAPFLTSIDLFLT